MRESSNGSNTYKVITATAVGTSWVILGVSPAYALTFQEMVDTVSRNPTYSFAAGCAAGAIVGSLIVSIANYRTKHELYEELEEVAASAQRAEVAARHAEERLKRYRSHQRMNQNRASYAAQREAAARRSAPQHAAQPVAQHAPQPAPRRVAHPAPQPVVPQPVVQQPAPVPQPVAPQPVAQPAPAPAPAPAQTAPVANAQTGKLPRRNVRDTLFARLRSDALEDDMPVINRGAVMAQPVSLEQSFPGLGHTNSVSSPMPVGATNDLHTLTRSSIINRRVPRFDESLFPETAPQPVAGAQQVDDFERAMRAMDEAMAHEQASAQQASVQQTTAQPASSQMSEHLERMVREEMELSKNGSSRSYSRPHLTVFEGTGDLGGAKSAARGPRHMSAVAREA